MFANHNITYIYIYKYKICNFISVFLPFILYLCFYFVLTYFILIYIGIRLLNGFERVKFFSKKKNVESDPMPIVIIVISMIIDTILTY